MREDPSIVTLRNAIIKCGFTVNCCKNIEETHDAFKKTNYDLVFIDCRRNQSNPKLNTNLINSAQNSYEPENICLYVFFQVFSCVNVCVCVRARVLILFLFNLDLLISFIKF